MEAPAAWGEEMERVLARFSAFLPRSPLPLDHMTSDDDGADVVAFLGRAMDDAITTNFAGLYYPMKGRAALLWLSAGPSVRGPRLRLNSGRGIFTKQC